MRTIAALIVLVGSALSAKAAAPDFDKEIAPLLAEHCLGCHSGPKPRGDLDLSKKTSLADGIVTPGKPTESRLWEQIAKNEMPPKKPLPPAARAAIKGWIESGAKWGTDPIDPVRFTTATRAGSDWWSFQPLRSTAPPTITNNAWPKTPIDRFILARLTAAKLNPTPEADRRTLIRRVTMDLTGLLPSPAEVAAFEADKAPDAYDKVVDRLLASPHYGERWARHWLDVVRYGETDGFERNDARPNAWHYRDWVIRAFNADMPYDEFVRQQIAGDLIKPGSPDGIAATGYLVAGVHNTVLPGNDVARQTARQDELEDLVGNVGQTFLGLSVQCARCHDHKFDPIPQKDYYRLAASVAGVTHGERTIVNREAAQERDRLIAEIRKLETEKERLDAPARQAVLSKKSPGTSGLPTAPTPLKAWDFRSANVDVQLAGSAKLTPAGLVLDGKAAVARTRPIDHPLLEKTLEAWAIVDSLDQRGGAILTVETPDGGNFDAIIFGEKEPRRWMAGSDFFRRTRSFNGVDETSKEAVHVALTYAADGTITAYRNGRPYGTAYRSPGTQPFEAGKYIAAFGIRHEPVGGNKMFAGTIVQARLYDRALSSDEIARSAQVKDTVTEADLVAAMSAEQRARRTALEKVILTLRSQGDRLNAKTQAKVYAVVPQKLPVTRFLVRGQVSEPADVMTPGGLRALGRDQFPLPATIDDSATRVALADWITRSNHALFARVIVNRVWHYHFGTGIVETPSDFGFNGGRPSHPELLDWLASEFQKTWTLKSLHRLIVTSAIYRQGSALNPAAHAIDADNRLLWRKRPLRIDGEAVRDAMLDSAGLLNREIGGPSFSDYKVTGGAGTMYYEPQDPVGAPYHRRSIYRFLPRGGNPGLLDTFDCPDPAASAPRRNSTTTPLQALALWNGPFALRMAETLAKRVETAEQGNPARQVDMVYRLVYQRPPTMTERTAAIKLATAHGLTPLARALFNSNEFLTID